MKTFTLFTLLFSLFATTYAFAQTKEEQNKLFRDTYNQSKMLVESQDYSSVGDMVYKNKTRERLKADSNTISVKKTEVSGTLATLSSENKTFKLNGTIEDYKVSFDDEKQQISIRFTVKSESQPLEVSIEVKPNGNAFLEVKSRSSSASYIGKLKNL
jgi:hypothetical protein